MPLDKVFIALVVFAVVVIGADAVGFLFDLFTNALDNAFDNAVNPTSTDPTGSVPDL